MFCSKCGKQIQPGTVFCPGCGQKIGAEPAAQAQGGSTYDPFASDKTANVNHTQAAGGANQPYQAPQQTFQAPQQPYQAPAQGYAPYSVTADTAGGAVAAKKKPGKKGLIIGLAALAAIAVLLFLLFTFVIGNSPEAVALRFAKSVYPNTNIKTALNCTPYGLTYNDVKTIQKLANKYDESGELDKIYDRYGTKDLNKLAKKALKEELEGEFGNSAKITWKAKKTDKISKDEMKDIISNEKALVAMGTSYLENDEFVERLIEQATGEGNVSSSDVKTLIKIAKNVLKKYKKNLSGISEMRKVELSGKIKGGDKSEDIPTLEIYAVKVNGRWKVYYPVAEAVKMFTSMSQFGVPSFDFDY